MSTPFSEAQRVKEKHEKDLLAIKGIVGIGFNGSIIVYVEKLTPQIASFIPRTLDGVAVHIKETGKIKLLSFPVVDSIYGSRVDRVRPLTGGISVGNYKTTAGTLTCGAKNKVDGKLYGLSSNHVVALQWGEMTDGQEGDAILQPGVIDGGVMEDKIGELVFWKAVESSVPNLVDVGLFSVDIIKDIIDVGKPSNTIDAKVGQKVKKSGRTTGLTFGNIIDTHATVKVEGWGEVTFADQIVVSPSFSAPGDSGSWVGDENDNTVGIVFAGSPEVTIVNKAKTIEELLQVEFAPSIEFIPVWKVIAIPAVVLGGVGVHTVIGGK